MNKIYLFFLFFVVFTVGCSTQETSAPVNNKVPAQGFEDIDEAVVGSDGNAKEFAILAKQWEFEPEVIEANLGDNVKLNIKSLDVTHGFALPDFSVNSRIDAGKTTTVEFIADKKGSFNFFCNVQCGEGHGGMRGKLVVN